MKEEELNATMSVIADPINNVYKLDSRQAIEEIQRICRIFSRTRKTRKRDSQSKIKKIPTMPWRDYCWYNRSLYLF